MDNALKTVLPEDAARIFIRDTPREACRVLLESILAEANSCSTKPLHIAFSGGSTPAALFELWRDEYVDRTPWERFELYQVDERCVPPGDPQSNYGLANRLLFSKLTGTFNTAGNAPAVYRIDGESPPEKEALRYSDLLQKNLECENRVPLFDFVLLGIGDDGHTSSIFPGLEHLLDCEEPCAVSVNPYNGSVRICVTGRPLLRARNTFFLVTGAQKRTVTEQVLQKENVSRYPASWVWHNAQNSRLFASF